MPEGRFIAYVRVSSTEQDTALQMRDRTIRNCDKIYEEKVSSYSPHRPALDACLSDLKRGDTLVVWKLDRLGRKTLELLTLIEEFRSRGINFVCTTIGLDTGTSTGRLVLRVLAAAAEFERDTLVERTNAGIQAARAKGHFGGRRRKLTGETLERAMEAYRNRPINPATGKRLTNDELSKMFGVSKPTLQRWALHNGVPTWGPQQEGFHKLHPDLDEWRRVTDDPNWGLNPDKPR